MSLVLAGCNTVGDSFSDAGEKAGADAFAAATPQDETTAPFGEPTPAGRLLGADPADDLATGKAYFRATNYGMAEKHFRRAVEQHPNDAEAWLDLAASYDHLKRFDLADRAYGQAIRLAGPKVEIINNQGYSYMLRGDTARARQKLEEARRRAPGNTYVLSNLRLLEESARRAKAIE
ncbi:tetratricopeptide repeat protein [Undibacter mobilis]|uniref:tetratricopeptide repeat protein n=1 Tax=Undibacter mobilis TaxID=2292256 RepID=UPI001FE1F9AE|nr:tetratricopeptide repeat protein [Undibacter mobilis]